jgi:hypothetical protein
MSTVMFRRDKLPLPQTIPKSHPAMQPADLLAWETFDFLKRGERRRCLVNLAHGTTFFEGIMNERNLVRLVHSVKLPPSDSNSGKHAICLSLYSESNTQTDS